MSIDPSLELFLQAVLERKALDIVALDVRELTTMADVFIICSGRSNRQVSAIAEHIRTTLKKHRIRPLSVEGRKEGHWVLMDYGHVVIHIFYEPVRSFYNLESLWADAVRIRTPALEAAGEPLGGRNEDSGEIIDEWIE
jgi:ribosome-associated protein